MESNPLILHPLALPPAVEAVFHNFLSCEFATLGKGDVPITWPTLPIYWPEAGQFVIASPLAFSQKAANVRRNPRVALLYSHPAGSGLDHPPAVLVQGQAVSSPEVVLSYRGLAPSLLAALTAQGHKLMGLQPACGCTWPTK